MLWQTYSELCYITKKELFIKIVNGFQPLPISGKSSILDVWHNYKYAFVLWFELRKENFTKKKSLELGVFCKNQWISTNNIIVFQDKPQFTVYVICDSYQFSSFRDHSNTQDTFLCKLSQFFNHLFFIKYWLSLKLNLGKEKNNLAILFWIYKLKEKKKKQFRHTRN